MNKSKQLVICVKLLYPFGQLMNVPNLIMVENVWHQIWCALDSKKVEKMHARAIVVVQCIMKAKLEAWKSSVLFHGEEVAFFSNKNYTLYSLYSRISLFHRLCTAKASGYLHSCEQLFTMDWKKIGINLHVHTKERSQNRILRRTCRWIWWRKHHCSKLKMSL